jgi:hypothetical protein
MIERIRIRICINVKSWGRIRILKGLGAFYQSPGLFKLDLDPDLHEREKLGPYPHFERARGFLSIYGAVQV